MDFRRTNLKPGRYLLGCHGELHGIISYHRVAAIESARCWARLRKFHRSLGKAPPYEPKTFVFRISVLKRYEPPVKYRHRRGAIGVCIYRG